MPKNPPPNECVAIAIRSGSLPHRDALKKRRAGERVPSETRRKVLRLFEDYEGNVSRVCKEVGIARRTFYRWMHSPTRINQKFRQQIAHTRPDEIKIDRAEETLSKKVHDQDLVAAIFTLKTKGRRRGWSERPDAEAFDLLDKVTAAFNQFVSSRPGATVEDKARWVAIFAEKARVEQRELAKRVGITDAG